MEWNIETEREDDGRWIAEIPAVPGVIVYGATQDEAKRKAYALALRVIADDVESAKNVPRSIKVDCVSA
ncbi:MAG: type II toxin-antitoxin system HicB family antitoxin [Terriglobales bacterium]